MEPFLILVVVLSIGLSIAIAWILAPTAGANRSGPSEERFVVRTVDRLRRRQVDVMAIAPERRFYSLLQMDAVSARREVTEPPPVHYIQTDYLLRYPAYRFGLAPFVVVLDLGSKTMIEEMVGKKLLDQARQTGALVFEAVDPEPLLTAEIVLPPERAKADEKTARQTRRLRKDQPISFQFLITPTLSDDLPIGVRLSYQVPVLKQTRSTERVKTTGSLDPKNCQEMQGRECEQTTEKLVESWERVDVELVTLWATVRIRTVLGLSTGTANFLKLALTPLVTLAVLWLIIRRGDRPDLTYLVVVALLNAIGVTVPQALTDALKPKVQAPTETGPFT